MHKSKADRLNALEIGKGIKYLLNEAYNILGNPVLTHDMEYNVIAYTENIVSDDPIWNEFVTTGTVDFSRLLFYKEENFLDAAANTKNITFLSSDKLKYDRIYGKLFNRDNIQVGCACITEANRPFDNDDPMLFDLFCEILIKEISMSEYYRNYGQAYQEKLISMLIDRNIEDKGIYTAHVESIYMNLEDYLYLVVVDTAKSVTSYTELACYRDMFKQIRPDYKYSIYDKYILIIASSADEIPDMEKGMTGFSSLFQQHNMRVGISECFDNLFELHKYYTEAVNRLHA